MKITKKQFDELPMCCDANIYSAMKALEEENARLRDELMNAEIEIRDLEIHLNNAYNVIDSEKWRNASPENRW